MLVNSNLPRWLLSFVNERSPSKTWIKTVGWLSAAVEKLYKVSHLEAVWSEKIIDNVHLGLASGNNRVAGNQLGEDTTSGLNAEGKSGNVDKDDILCALLSREDTTLDGSTVCNSLIGVNALRGVSAAKEFLEKLLDLGYTGGTADEYDLV